MLAAPLTGGRQSMGRSWENLHKARAPRFLNGCSWSRGVTVSTLDSESSDRGSNPRGTFFGPSLHRAHTSPHNLLASLTSLSPPPFFKPLNLWRNTTSRGFEPLQAEPNEFQVYLLSRSGCRAATILALARMLQGLRSLVRDTVSERLRRWTRNPLGSARRGSNPLGVACCARARGKPMQVRPPGIEPGTI